MELQIGEFAKLTGLSIHTLRYYESEGILQPVRNSGNQRRYAQSDLAWIDFVKRLKATGMPIKEIARYARLREQGDTTMHERLQMLEAHREVLDQELAQLQSERSKLNDKIQYYHDAITQNESH